MVQWTVICQIMRQVNQILRRGFGKQFQLSQRVLGAPGAAVAGQLGTDQEGALTRGFGGVQPPSIRSGSDG